MDILKKLKLLGSHKDDNALHPDFREKLNEYLELKEKNELSDDDIKAWETELEKLLNDLHNFEDSDTEEEATEKIETKQIKEQIEKTKQVAETTAEELKKLREKDKQRDFAELIKTANRAFKLNNFVKAKEFYEKALSLYENEQAVIDRIAECETKLQEIAEEKARLEEEENQKQEVIKKISEAKDYLRSKHPEISYEDLEKVGLTDEEIGYPKIEFHNIVLRKKLFLLEYYIIRDEIIEKEKEEEKHEEVEKDKQK